MSAPPQVMEEKTFLRVKAAEDALEEEITPLWQQVGYFFSYGW